MTSESRAVHSDSQRVLALIEKRDLVERELVGALAEWDFEQRWALDGALHPIPWLIHHCAVTRAEASQLVAKARVVQRCDNIADALADGTLSTSHLGLLARAGRHREQLLEEHQGALVDAAQSAPPEQYRQIVRRWQALADDIIADAEAVDAFEHRRLHVSPTFEGSVVINGRLDPEGGARLIAALKDALPPSGGTPAQRRADALVALVTGERPGVTLHLIATEATLTTSPASPGSSAVLDQPSSEISGLGTVPASISRRLACDATVGTRDAAGLSLGRSRRLVSRSQRQALAVRDGGCSFPGCDRPPEWTDAHHLHHWADGGNTDLDNLVLLCRRHHVLCHEGSWRLERMTDGRLMAVPP